jgi:hypothetical protein
MRSIVLMAILVGLAGGCASPTVHSHDAKANYRYVFGNLSAPEPTIVRSHVERESRKFPGTDSTKSEYNGNWEFELVASSAWLNEVKTGFVEIQFTEVQPREAPDWFRPSPGEFTVWRMQRTSYPNAHLFIEKKPASQERIKVFMRRH